MSEPGIEIKQTLGEWLFDWGMAIVWASIIFPIIYGILYYQKFQEWRNK